MSKESNSQAFPFLSILQLIFITLKLTGFINWSWWWVLSPLLIGTGVAIVALLVMLVWLAKFR